MTSTFRITWIGATASFLVFFNLMYLYYKARSIESEL